MSGHYRIHPGVGYLYFMTATVVEWIPLFITRRFCDLILDSFEHCRREKGLRLHAYVIMPNHLHLIGSTIKPPAMSGIMRDFKRFTSRTITELLEEEGSRFNLRLLARECNRRRGNSEYKVWQDGFHPIALWSPRFLRQRLEYIHDNPVRKGLVRRPEDWVYSSATDYLTRGRGPMEIDKLAVW